MAQELGVRRAGAGAGGRVMFEMVPARRGSDSRGSDGRLRAKVRALRGRSGSGDSCVGASGLFGGQVGRARGEQGVQQHQHAQQKRGGPGPGRGEGSR